MTLGDVEQNYKRIFPEFIWVELVFPDGEKTLWEDIYRFSDDIYRRILNIAVVDIDNSSPRKRGKVYLNCPYDEFLSLQEGKKPKTTAIMQRVIVTENGLTVENKVDEKYCYEAVARFLSSFATETDYPVIRIFRPHPLSSEMIMVICENSQRKVSLEIVCDNPTGISQYTNTTGFVQKIKKDILKWVVTTYQADFEVTRKHIDGVRNVIVKVI